jgi:signal transduction histidine kinase
MGTSGAYWPPSQAGASRCRPTPRPAWPTSPSWWRQRSRTRRAAPVWPGWPTNSGVAAGCDAGGAWGAAGRAVRAITAARIVAAADETRRQIERDLHNGIQQRLVSLGLELRATQAGRPLPHGELEAVVARAADGLRSVFDELREISQASTRRSCPMAV